MNMVYKIINSRLLIYVVTVVLLFIVVETYLADNETNIAKYESKIEMLNLELEALKVENITFSKEVDSLRANILTYKETVDNLKSKIYVIKKETQQKINNVDSYNNDELYKFFADRYRYIKDSIK